MLDHVFLSVSDIERSINFYTQTLAPLGITDRVDFDGKDGPPGHPDLKGFGCKGRFILWLRLGAADSRAAHVGFVAKSRGEVDAAYAAAIAAGALLRSALLCRQRVRPRRLQPRICFKSWQHPKPKSRKSA
jgi:catechol 2,3-dioxygenase-like lactoylglutathione lyase family enzyme